MADLINVIQQLVGDGTTPVTTTNPETLVVSSTNSKSVWAKIAILKQEINIQKDAVNVIQDEAEATQTDIITKHGEVQTWASTVDTQSGVVDTQYTDLVGADGLTGKIGQFNTDYATIDLTKMEVVADNMADVTAVEDALTDIATVKTHIANVNTVALDLGYDTDADGGTHSAINAVAANKTNIDAAAGNASDITTVAGMGTDITNVLGLETVMTAVATNEANITAVVGNETNINAAVANETNINAVVTNETHINGVYDNIDTIGLVNNNKANIDTVAGLDTKITTVATDLDAGVNSDVITVADNLQKGVNSEIVKVAENIANVSGSINTAEANALAAVNAKDDSVIAADLASQWANKMTDNGEVGLGSGEYSSKKWSYVAEEWAEKDTAIGPGQYSAKYWAEQAQEVVSGEIIDDSVTNTLKTYSSSKIEELHDVQSTAIAALATAQAQITNESTPTFDPFPEVETTMPFNMVSQSSNEDVVSVNAAGDTIVFKVDASFNFLSTVTLSSSTDEVRHVTFKLVNTADDAVLVTQTNLIDIAKNTSETMAMNTLITVGKNGIPSTESGPVTVRITAQVDGAGIVLESFNSILASSSNYDLTGKAANVDYDGTTNIDLEATAGLEDVQLAVEALDAATKINTAITGTETLVRYDKLLGNRDILEMLYTDGNLTTVRYTGDNDTDMYYRDELTYTTGDLTEVKHYFGIINTTVASGTTALTYVGGDLSTTSYTE